MLQKTTSCLRLTCLQATCEHGDLYWIKMQAANQTTYQSSYRITPELPAPHYSTPNNNYFSGDGKSIVWADAQYYVPSERAWIRYPDHRSLPRESRRDAIDFQSEDQWVNFMRNRDQPTGYYYPNRGNLMCNDTGLRLNAYHRVDPAPKGPLLFRAPLRKLDAWVAPIRKLEGDYHTFYRARQDKKKELENRFGVEFGNPVREDQGSSMDRYMQLLNRRQRHQEVPVTEHLDPGKLQKCPHKNRWAFDLP